MLHIWKIAYQINCLFLKHWAQWTGGRREFNRESDRIRFNHLIMNKPEIYLAENLDLLSYKLGKNLLFGNHEYAP